MKNRLIWERESSLPEAIAPDRGGPWVRERVRFPGPVLLLFRGCSAQRPVMHPQESGEERRSLRFLPALERAVNC
jgi:hypothetical protein